MKILKRSNKIEKFFKVVDWNNKPSLTHVKMQPLTIYA